MEVVAGLDIDIDSSNSFVKNFPAAISFRGDIRQMAAEILQPVLKNRDAPILFSGCAPCQPFSRQNKSSNALDPRRTLLREFSRFVEAWLPEYIFIENVPGMQKLQSNSPLKNFQKKLKSLCYHTDCGIVPALWYGVPQTRERLVLIASRVGPIAFPKATHGNSSEQKAFTTVSDWIRNLPPIAAGETHKDDPDHVAAKLSRMNLTRIQSTPEGKGRESWPPELWLDCHKTHNGHSDVYGRLSWNKQASGLTTRCISYSNGRFGHPEQDRAISVREAACLQTFPVNYQFSGSVSSRARQIGNAVPPKMAEAFGVNFISNKNN